MQTRIFARGIKRFVTITVESDNKAGDAVDVTLLEDGTDPALTMLWRVTGREAVSRVLYAISHKNLQGLMDALEGITGSLPNMEPEPDCDVENGGPCMEAHLAMKGAGLL